MLNDDGFEIVRFAAAAPAPRRRARCKPSKAIGVQPHALPPFPSKSSLLSSSSRPSLMTSTTTTTICVAMAAAAAAGTYCYIHGMPKSLAARMPQLVRQLPCMS